MKTIITHNGSFHADDVFACATLSLVFKDEEMKIIRTRDKEEIESGDIVLDVGRIYDSEKNRFDHHQESGAGKRENGIPYASFGLIWKKYSHYICPSIESTIIDQRLVQVIDAIDAGVDLFKSLNENVSNYNISSVIASFNSTFLEEDRSDDEAFTEAMEIAKKIILREIEGAKEMIVSKEIFHKAYEDAEDKRVVEVPKNILKEGFEDYEDVLYIVYPYNDVSFGIRTMRKNKSSFDSKKPFPEEWGGKEGKELQDITGVSDAIFCHRGLFIASAKSIEGARKLAKLAIEA